MYHKRYNNDFYLFTFFSVKAFIYNGTVRENILFGASYEPNLFARVVQCCSLAPDLESFSDGDLTEIGERGINLSGGQKQVNTVTFYSSNL